MVSHIHPLQRRRELHFNLGRFGAPRHRALGAEGLASGCLHFPGLFHFPGGHRGLRLRRDVSFDVPPPHVGRGAARGCSCRVLGGR
eukprot:351567-Pyramimonas_sp.AAC.1